LLLNLAETLYHRALVKRRARFLNEAERVAAPVISVGNITSGGVGKTPAVQMIARWLQDQNLRVAVVARGYRGSLSKAGAVVSDGETIFKTAREAGDEPLLHARALPDAIVVIGQDRIRAAREAIRLGAQIIVLDDAFQFWSLSRDFDLVLLDARRPFHNNHLLPRGHLREEPAALSRADAFLLTRADKATSQQIEAARALIAAHSSAPIWEARHVAVGLRDEATGARIELEILKDCPIGALSALADNGAFSDSLLHYGARVMEKTTRRDHHFWTESETRRAAQKARECGAQAMITTEKDAVKLRAQWTSPLPLWSLLIEMCVAEEDELRAQLEQLTAGV